MTDSQTSNSLPAPHLHFSRTFNASRDLLFDVFTKEDHLLKWWGPKGCEMLVAKMDVRPEGVFHYNFKFPSQPGDGMWGKFVFTEVNKPEKLQFIVSFCDKDGNIIAHPFSPTWPLEVLSTYTFQEDGDKTTVIFESEPHNAPETQVETYRQGLEGLKKGLNGTLDQLDEYLAGLKA